MKIIVIRKNWNFQNIVIALLLGLINMQLLKAQSFTEQAGILLQGVNNSSVAWGDYDNDGNLDILLTGATNTGVVSKIYHNNGNNTFTEQPVTLTGVFSGSVAWGDYDNDGYLDIILSGLNNTKNPVTKIYHNNGNGTFTEQPVTLIGVYSGSVAWGDYDNDGYLDILLTGYTLTGTTSISIIYKNNGGNTFTEQTGISLTGVSGGNAAWGDYDNDGYLDILMTGSGVTKIYHNNGNGTFTEQMGISLPGLSNGSVAWGDYDNDGYLDILLVGKGSGYTSAVYRNNGNNTFTEQTSISLAKYKTCHVAWGDYDNDGYLDILIAGTFNSSGVSDSNVYHNNRDNTFTALTDISLPTVDLGFAVWGDYDNDGKLDILLTGSGFAKIYRNNGTISNTEASAPANLQTTINGSNVTFTWDKTNDTETSQNGLNYNLYVYEDGQTTYKRTPDAFKQTQPNNGRRLVAEIGNIQYSGAGYTLKNLPFGSYKWSVQAVDGGLQGGSFAAEASFTFSILGNVGVNVANGQITNTTTVMSYSLNSTDGINGNWTVCSATNTSVNFGTGGFDVWVHANGIIIIDKRKVATIVAQAAAPAYSFDYINETTNQNVAATDEYSVKADMISATSGTGVPISVTPGQNLYLRIKATTNSVASAIQTLVVANRPATPIYSADLVNETTRENVSVTDEYSANSDMSGAVIGTGVKIPITPGQNLYFRVKSTTSSFKSLIQTLVVPPIFADQTSISLAGVAISSAAWGDYDNDGNLDILLTGLTSAGETVTKIYHNNGDNTFTEQTGTTLIGVSDGSVAWGDYDNDGYLDILLTGWSGFTDVAKIYRNNGNRTFTEQTSIALPGVSMGSVAWGDYDNDGYVDILLTGSSTTYITKIFHNNGNNTFTELTGVSLTGVYNSSVAWGDYDNDGDLDILLTGDTGSARVSKIYRNNGDNTFTEQTGIPFIGVSDGSVAWGDYDNDGFLDILLTGDTGSARVSKVYRNNGDNTFTEQTGILLTGVFNGSVAWGDYNNDGYLDILLTGRTGSIGVSKIYRNNGNNTFTEQTRILLSGVYYGSAAWGDYDNDGNLDILLTGNSNSTRICKVYLNNRGAINTAASAPLNLQSTLRNGTDVTFRWNKATDNETPQNGLIYNLYVYKEGSSNYKRTPNAFAQTQANNGRRLIAQLGDIQYNGSGYILRNLPTGNYKWSVQAIDGGLKGGSFAAEASFTFVNLSNVGVNVAFNQITNTISAMEYSINSTDGSNGIWTPCMASNTNLDFAAGGFDVWVRQVGFAANNRKVATIDAQVVSPAYTIDYINETTNEIFVATDEYSLNQDMIIVISGTGKKLTLIPGQNLYFRVKATASKVSSSIQLLKMPNRPAMPVYTIDYVSETTSANIATTDEYSVNADMSRASVGTGANVSLIPGQNLYFRTKPTNLNFRSSVQTLVVQNRPVTPTNPIVDDVANTFNWTNNPSFIIASDYEFSTDNGDSWTTCLRKPINVGNVNITTGALKIRIKATDMNFRSDDLSSNAAFTIITGLDNIMANNINLYPNPVKDVMLIDHLTENAEVSIYSSDGILMKVIYLNNTNEIWVSDLPSGMYILKLQSNKIKGQTKFMKQ